MPRILAGVRCVLIHMEPLAPPTDGGPFEARYLAFLETVVHLRPRLHRYCARMTGSALDGEDVVQEALIVAYRSLETYDQARPLAPWLYRIAHNRCIDFLRRRRVRRRAESFVPPLVAVAPAPPEALDVDRAVEHLVQALPPMERACVLLKDVFDHSLGEIAELTGATTGAVKSALHRGRARLAQSPPAAPRTPTRTAVPETLRRFVERFTRRDWDGVRSLLAEDARLRVADRFQGTLARSPYFGNYERLAHSWRMTPGLVDGEPVVLVWSGERPAAAIRLAIENGRVVRVTDYYHCEWVLPAADVVAV